METTDTSTSGSVKQAVLDFLQSTADQVPTLVVALLVIIAGWLLARLARRGARQTAALANRFLDRALRRGSAAGVRISMAFISVTGEVVFWLVLIVAVVVAAGIVGIGSIGQWINQLVVHLPSLIVGAAIVVVGYFLSVYLRELVTSSAESSEIRTSATLGRLVQVAVISVALIVGLDQAGIDVAILMIVFAVIGSGLVIGVTVAFGVGARDFVGNLIGARNARQFLQPGMHVRIGEVEGEIMEIFTTHITLDTADGKTLLPGQRLETQQVIILTPGEEGSAADG